MTNQPKRKTLRELNLLDRFLFDEVMEDTGAYQAALEIILGKDIHLLGRPQTEKEQRTLPSLRGIRMDVWGEDEVHTIYNSEMQRKNTRNLPRRSRYYQGILDAGQLEPGSIDFNQLNDTYLITICPFDLFGEKKFLYTFRMRCDEKPELSLEDGAVRIFLNTKGDKPKEISEELYEFLQYIGHSDEETAARSDSPRIWKIHERVKAVKANEASEVKYMQLWEEKVMERLEGEAEGIVNGIELMKQVQKLASEGLSEEEIVIRAGVSAELVRRILE